MKIDISKPEGVKLKTAGKFCDKDITVTPILQKKNVTTNGEVTPDIGYAGLSSIIVDVPASEEIEWYNGSLMYDYGS